MVRTKRGPGGDPLLIAAHELVLGPEAELARRQAVDHGEVDPHGHEEDGREHEEQAGLHEEQVTPHPRQMHRAEPQVVGVEGRDGAQRSNEDDDDDDRDDDPYPSPVIADSTRELAGKILGLRTAAKPRRWLERAGSDTRRAPAGGDAQWETPRPPGPAPPGHCRHSRGTRPRRRRPPSATGLDGCVAENTASEKAATA